MARHYFYLIILILSFSYGALASESVQFTNKELGAVFTLLRPELNSVELSGRKAVFDPSPAMKYLGMQHSETPLDLTVIADLVDLEFNHLKAKMPVIAFENGIFKLSLPVEDQVRAIQSNLGSISFKDVVLISQLGWSTRADGSQELVLLKTEFQGALKGSGILRSQFILGKARDLCMRLLTKSLKKMLNDEKIQNEVISGLLNYGKFYTGDEVKEIAPGSIQLFNEGIRYDVN